jgi:glycosyltransferase involved in cell wall biosynthesis
MNKNVEQQGRHALRVVHNSVIHLALDVRIFHKECVTLADQGYDVHLIVPDPPSADVNGVTFHALDHRWKGRPQHLWSTLSQSYRLARRLRPDIYHFHDPILIPVGVLLKLAGARVIYDVHEDAPREALTLCGDRRWVGWTMYGLWTVLEAVAKLVFDRHICVTPTIAQRFPPDRTVLVQNYPLLSEYADIADRVTYDRRPPQAVFVGGISRQRGIREMVEAFTRLTTPPEAYLRLVGPFDSPALEEQMRSEAGWERVRYDGYRNRREVADLLSHSRLGLVLYHPTRDHLTAQPNKLFEYMAAGLPVVASDFPLWRSIVERAGCGLVVDPSDPTAIAAAVEWLLQHPGAAEEMGRRGKQAVYERFNWSTEAQVLVETYARVAP